MKLGTDNIYICKDANIYTDVSHVLNKYMGHVVRRNTFLISSKDKQVSMNSLYVGYSILIL